MAKESLITRTITTSTVTVLCLDVDSGEPENRTFTLPRTYAKEKDILRRAKAQLDEAGEANVHAVHVVDVKVNETLYGMPESLFLAHASVIDKPAKKAEA